MKNVRGSARTRSTERSKVPICYRVIAFRPKTKKLADELKRKLYEPFVLTANLLSSPVVNDLKHSTVLIRRFVTDANFYILTCSVDSEVHITRWRLALFKVRNEHDSIVCGTKRIFLSAESAINKWVREGITNKCVKGSEKNSFPKESGENRRWYTPIAVFLGVFQILRVNVIY